MENIHNIKRYLAISISIHITLLFLLLSIRTVPLKQPRVAFVDLIDIPRAIDIAVPELGMLESKREKGNAMVGKVPDLPVNPDLMPERTFSPLPSGKEEKKVKKSRLKAPAKSTVKRVKKLTPLKGSSKSRGGGEPIPRVKEFTPSLGKMVLAARTKKRKGEGKGEGENVGSKNIGKDKGDYSEVAGGGTELTPLDSPSIKYISYFAGIKRKIELVWQYPFEAIQRGIQGDVVVDFAIGRDGKLSKLKLVKSSGYKMLDKEALESIRKGSPFSPIPVQYKIDILNIRANFIYEMHYLKVR
jgi:protein TonB